MKSEGGKLFLRIRLLIVFATILTVRTSAQAPPPDKIAERFFIPALQIGYINHNSESISAGLIVQTSLEYRTKRNLLLRLNYDDFSGRLNLRTADNQSYSARIPTSELIGGLGYRITKDRHNYFLLAQTGIRFYENPTVRNENGAIAIEQVGSTIGSMRYTLGYEYELFDQVFLNSEVFLGHFLREKDFWLNSNPFFGITVGISARLF